MSLYTDLLKRTLTGMIYEDPALPVSWRTRSAYNKSSRENGRDWPLNAHTMIGLKRLDSLGRCIHRVIVDDIPGDFIETGVWRGGTCIFMRGMLEERGVKDRIVWVADSFKGFPPSSEIEDDNALIAQPEQAYLAVSEDDVMRNFALYGLLDGQVRFLPGWFSETLPGPVKQLSILRLDSDLYSSTMESLVPLYPLLQPGGYCIIDDWNVPMCRKSVIEYRGMKKITEPIQDIDGHSVYWRKD